MPWAIPCGTKTQRRKGIWVNISRKIVEQLIVAPLSAEEIRLLTAELESWAQLSEMLQEASVVGSLLHGQDVRL